MGEFDLIRRHFRRNDAPAAPQVALGIGDDCALLQPAPGHQLAISTDMLVEGRHFFADVDPEALGHKALAVNLSDLAAMGARPLGCTLALSLPRADDAWLTAFARGLFALADAHACPLVGGDTTRGPLNICITVFGEVAPGRALRRDAAQPGDDIYISGRTGEARLALEWLLGTPWARAAVSGPSLSAAVGPELPADLRARLEWPTPRLALGQSLAGVAHAALDLSDGLTGDLGHILAASGVGADLQVNALPVAPALALLPEAERLTCLLSGGDDYELLFTAPASTRDAVQAAAHTCGINVSRVGVITSTTGLRLMNASGEATDFPAKSFDHFGC